MNQENFEYLRDQVKFTGFGDGLENSLKQKMETGDASFQLEHNIQYGKDEVNAVLFFNQSKQSEMYFFNSYQLSVQKEKEAEKLQQTFYINKANNITLKEAYNLICGRSVNKDLVNKEGVAYNAWVQLNFKESDDKGNFKFSKYNENYGYDLEDVLKKQGFKELNDPQTKQQLMDSLKKGNLQSVTVLKDGGEYKQYIEANPKFKTLNFYNMNMQRINIRQISKEKETNDPSQTVKQDAVKQQQKTAEEEDGSQASKKSKRTRKKRGQSV